MKNSAPLILDAKLTDDQIVEMAEAAMHHKFVARQALIAAGYLLAAGYRNAVKFQVQDARRLMKLSGKLDGRGTEEPDEN